ncbi:MAG: hypothetical protein IJS15_05135, partial [Victivallales bacterium]|nr:hypothetical protein [Victivallales bacterium]
IGSILAVTLFNREGRPVSNVQLSISTDGLRKLLRERISKGVSQFFVQLKNALRKGDASSIGKIHILLAGNSSKSPIVTEVFNEHIEALKKDYKAQSNNDTGFEFVLHPPLGFTPMEQKNAKDERANPHKNQPQKETYVSTGQFAQVEHDADDDGSVVDNASQSAVNGKASVDMRRPTGKTGVAFGLVYSRDGGNIKIVDNNLDSSGEISFRFFVGRPNRHQQFEALLSRDTPMGQWVKVMGVADRETIELKYTEEPSATTGLLPIIKTHTIPISVSQPSEMNFKLFVRIASATKIECVLAKDDASIDDTRIVAFELD